MTRSSVSPLISLSISGERIGIDNVIRMSLVLLLLLILILSYYVVFTIVAYYQKI